MNKRKIFLLFLFFSLCFNSPLVYAQPQAVLSESAFNLGKIPEGALLFHSFFIENKGNTQLKVKVFDVSCDCLEIIGSRKISIPPKATGEMQFTYDSSGRFGKIDEHIFISTNDPANKNIKYAITGEVELGKLIINGKFKTFNLGFMAFAGFVDGLNPCAFAILVFFISFLITSGLNKQRICLIGVSFLIASFLTYFTLGLGIFKILRQLLIFRLFSLVLYLGIAMLAIFLGLFSLYDAWIYKRSGDFNRLKIKLPASLRDKIQNLVTAKDLLLRPSAKVKIIAGAFVLGLVVTLLESVCTGQIYLPTIALILNIPNLRIRALFSLLIYNLMFILPLVVVFLLLLFELKSERLYAFCLKHVVFVKLTTAAVFFMFGAILLLIK